jgi:hypothetical protein
MKFFGTFIFFGKGLLAPRPTPKLEDHRLSTAAYSMYSQLTYMYELDLVGVQNVRWEGGGTEPAGEYTFLYGN